MLGKADEEKDSDGYWASAKKRDFREEDQLGNELGRPLRDAERLPSGIKTFDEL